MERVLNPILDYTPKQICDKYKALRKNLQTIKSSSSSGRLSIVGGRRKERHVRANRGEYVLCPEQFINEHHRMCALMPDAGECNSSPLHFNTYDGLEKYKYVCSLPILSKSNGDFLRIIQEGKNDNSKCSGNRCRKNLCSI